MTLGGVTISLRAANDAYNGFYVSLINKKYPKPYQSVLLPELLGGTESNMVATFMSVGDDPEAIVDPSARSRQRRVQSGAKLDRAVRAFAAEARTLSRTHA